MENDPELVLLGPADFRDFNPDHILPQPRHVIDDIRSWLRPTLYDHKIGEYRKHLSSLEEGTGTWLTTAPAYQSWLNSSNEDLLLIQGVPGSGKSVLAAKLIRDISAVNPDVPVLYFFFREILDANQTPAALLRDWLDQILLYSPPLQQHLKDQLAKKKEVGSLGNDDLWNLLRLALAGLPGRAYCVVDALDEMKREGSETFLNQLADLGTSMPSKVRILATSRLVPRITDVVRRAPTSKIRLESDMVDLDISTFVRQQLAASKMSAEDQDRVHEAIPGRAHGLFLYAKLARDAFLQPGANVQQVMTRLPDDLNVIYTNLMQTHASRSETDAEVQRLVLQAATHTTRALRLVEMADMIRIACPDLIQGNLGPVKEQIRNACGPLLEILPSETVSVIHHTLTEYLRGSNRPPGSDGYPILDPSDTHLKLGSVCVDYLQIVLETLEGEPSPKNVWSLDYEGTASEIASLRLRFPFIEYAVNNWGLHISKARLPAQKQLNDKIDGMLLKPLFLRNAVLFWWLHARLCNGRTEPVTTYDRYLNEFEEHLESRKPLHGPSQLHMAAIHGLGGYAEHLILKPNFDINIGDDPNRPPLSLAAEFGHADVVRALLSAGAQPATRDPWYHVPILRFAAHYNHAEVVQLLVDAGASPLVGRAETDAADEFGDVRPNTNIVQTPWGVVCQRGNLESFEVLLPLIQDPQDLSWGLLLAAAKGRERIVARVLEHDKTEKTPKVLGTALFRACEIQHVGIVKMLLAAGAEPNTVAQADVGLGYPGEARHACLEALCQAAYWRSEDVEPAKEIMALLIKHGADFRARHWKGNSALHYAANAPFLVQELLELGLDANQVNDAGEVPLHLARTPEAVASLAERGSAGINLRNKKFGRTPLLHMLARVRFQQETALRLLDFKPDCLVIDNEGRGPLHHALRYKARPLGPVPVVRRLLELGADPSLQDESGMRPLDICHYTSPEREIILDLFLGAGMYIDVKDAEGRTQLFRTMNRTCSFDQKQAQGLLEKGANKETRDSTGRTLLHEAVCNLENGSRLPTDDDAFRFFLDLGLDPRVVDNNGNTLLHELADAVCRGSGPDPKCSRAWDVLVDELGLDINQANHFGRTPLHVLATMIRSDYCFPLHGGSMKILSASMLDVQDFQGIAPLHLASTRSAQLVSSLLDKGANPKTRNFQELTPLHTAVRAGNPGCVGLLLDALFRTSCSTTDMDEESEFTPPGFWYHDPSLVVPNVDDKDERGWTALSYACRAGRADLVDLMLRAGADPTLRVHLEACAQFEDETTLPVVSYPGRYYQVKTFGVRIEDASRPGCSKCSGSGFCTVCKHMAPRLDDVLSMLLKADTGDTDRQKCDLVEIATSLGASSGKEYTRFCFQKAVLRNISGDTDPAISREELVTMRHWCVEYLEKMRQSLLKSSGNAEHQTNEAEPSVFDRLMETRVYELILDLIKTAVPLFAPSLDHEATLALAVDKLLENGMASLAKQVLILRTQALPGEIKQTTNSDQLIRQGDESIQYLLAALTGSMPNMEVLRLLVEECGVEVNACASSDSMAALHHVAKGRFWVHVALVLPYLLEHGADLSLRNIRGETPLQCALRERGRWFSQEAARMLIRANPEFSRRQPSPALLAAAKQEPALTCLIEGEEPEPSASVIMALVLHQLPEVLEEVLVRWPAHIVNTFGQPPQEERMACTPLHYALVFGRPRSTVWTDEWRRTRAKMTDILLKEGADPFAVSPRPVDSRTRNTEPLLAYDDRIHGKTVLQQALLHRSQFVGRVLAQQGFDINRRDDEGRTIFHMACIQAPTRPALVYPWPMQPLHTPSKLGVSPLREILLLGADPLGRDHAGRNALHHVLHGFTENGMEPSQLCFGDHLEYLAFLTGSYPELIDERTNNGKTPLLLAAHRAVVSQNATAAFEHLLTAGADPRIADEDGNTILHILADGLDMSDVLGIFKQLRRKLGVDVKNKHGQTPLFIYARGERMAARHRDLDRYVRLKYTKKGVYVPPPSVLEMFEDAGADFDVTDDSGAGVLHAAAHVVDELGIERFKALRNIGIDAFLEDAEGRTALDIAVSCRNEEVVAMLDR